MARSVMKNKIMKSPFSGQKKAHTTNKMIKRLLKAGLRTTIIWMTLQKATEVNGRPVIYEGPSYIASTSTSQKEYFVPNYPDNNTDPQVASTLNN